MADYDKGTPVRSEADGNDQRLHSKIVDYTDPSGIDKQAEVSNRMLQTRDKQANIKLIFQLLQNANFLNLADYTSIVPSFVGDETYLDYFETDSRIARVTLRYVNDIDWDMTVTRFINDTDGDELLDDDSSFLNLD